MPREKSTSTYCGVLFCDNEEHERAIMKVYKYYDYFIIKHQGEEHDDIPFEVDEGEEPINTKGKDHWHFVIMFPYSVKRKYIAECLGIQENYIQNCSSRNGYLRYLTHNGDRRKILYAIENFSTNRPIVLNSALKGCKTVEELREEFFSIIQNKNWKEWKKDFTYTDFVCEINRLGYGDDLRRYAVYIKDFYIVQSGKPVYFFAKDGNNLTNMLTGEVL